MNSLLGLHSTGLQRKTGCEEGVRCQDVDSSKGCSNHGKVVKDISLAVDNCFRAHEDQGENSVTLC